MSILSLGRSQRVALPYCERSEQFFAKGLDLSANTNKFCPDPENIGIQRTASNTLKFRAPGAAADPYYKARSWDALCLSDFSIASAVPSGPLATLAHVSPTLTPGQYKIYQDNGARQLFVAYPGGPVLDVEGPGQDIFGPHQFDIMSISFHPQVAAQGIDNHIKLGTGFDKLLSIWAIESAGGNQWVIKIFNQDAVWKYNSTTHKIDVARADGSAEEHWEFIPAVTVSEEHSRGRAASVVPEIKSENSARDAQLTLSGSGRVMRGGASRSGGSSAIWRRARKRGGGGGDQRQPSGRDRAMGTARRSGEGRALGRHGIISINSVQHRREASGGRCVLTECVFLRPVLTALQSSKRWWLEDDLKVKRTYGMEALQGPSRRSLPDLSCNYDAVDLGDM
ncbi:hypothetical protein FB451DRAFT_1192333 [Mycena latifolia]|nr:hypothetical protein FB451DRAFT_1192333 [Mycena latifolia]